MLDKALKIFFTIFSLIWMIITFSEYWRYNPNYAKALELFQYYDVLLIVIAIGALITWYFKKPRKKEINHLNGLSIFGGMSVCA